MKQIAISIILIFISNTSFTQSINVSETYKNTNYNFSVKQIILPPIFIGYGIAALKNHRLNNFDEKLHDKTKYKSEMLKIDNFSQYMPGAAVFGLNLCGVRSNHHYLDLCALYGSSLIFGGAVVTIMKMEIDKKRPDNDVHNSFPSGHTATAFISAEFLRLENRDKPWIGISGYVVAASTGFLRMYNNRHWFSDVVAGAGIGILCTNIIYWIYPSNNFTSRHINNQKSITLLPYYNDNQNFGLSLQMSL